MIILENSKSSKGIQINPSSYLMNFNGSSSLFDTQNLLKNEALQTSGNEGFPVNKVKPRG